MKVGFIGLLVLIADIYAVLKIAQSNVSDGKKALWIAIVVVFPLGGVIIWYLMGPGRN
jgi:succinate dehydrogenase/fumarate reductase cytochrome b subunit